MATRRRRTAAGILLLSLAAVTTPSELAWADETVLHRVTYVVTADQPTEAGVYYRDVDPPTWADYSHNPYLYSPRSEISLRPGTPWVLDVMLADPDRWAMVAVTENRPQETRTLRCELTVDGIVVDTADGSHGALCSLRPW